MSDNIGIDISHYQESVPAGPWLFEVHAAGDGLNFVDPTFHERFAATQGLRGAYLYARPLESDGRTQANHFCDLVLAAGFKKNEDLWQLDCEDGENAGANDWAQFISDFMWTAFTRLGHRGFLYAGWPFVEAHGLQTSIKEFQWWLPDYGPNDGQVHAPQTPADITPLVVLHQFTSTPFDQSIVQNEVRWQALVPPGNVVQFYEWCKLVTIHPLEPGISSWEVTALKQMFNKIGEGPGNDSPFFGEKLAACVVEFKKKHGVDNIDPGFGGVALAALLKLL